MTKREPNSLKWILPVVTVARYIFLALAATGLIVNMFDAQDTFLAPYFREKLKSAYVFTFFVCEASYWALKYKKLLAETKR